MCQYAGHHADTNAKKREHFRRGLSTKLQERLNLVRADSFNDLVNLAITQEDLISAHHTEKEVQGTYWTLECLYTEVSYFAEYFSCTLSEGPSARALGYSTSTAAAVAAAAAKSLCSTAGTEVAADRP